MYRVSTDGLDFRVERKFSGFWIPMRYFSTEFAARTWAKEREKKQERKKKGWKTI